MDEAIYPQPVRCEYRPLVPPTLLMAGAEDRRGKDGAKAFYALMATVDLEDFKVTGLLAGDDHVCALVSIKFTVKATGIRVSEQEIQLWSFNDQGQVTALQHFGDTAKHIAANGG